MTSTIIIAICSLLLLAYVFDITAPRTRIPSVILLLLLGWAVGQIISLLNITMPDLEAALPILGTLGLILIVLEGSLELEINKSKIRVIWKSLFIAILPMGAAAYLLAWALAAFSGVDYRIALINAIPLTVISSAIAIPSAKSLISSNREFITYESSMSDILGIMFFNFMIYNTHLSSSAISEFGIEMILVLLISSGAIIGLIYLLSKIKAHVKFVPIILIIILVYSISKDLHLPALVIILLVGLILRNLNKLEKLQFINRLHPEVLKAEVKRFHELIIEATFLIKALFFLLFGFLIDTLDLINPSTFVWALAITIGIFAIRAIFLKVVRLPLRPLLFMAPRGLITILLFISIPIAEKVDLVNKSLIIQTIILSALVMMFGLMWGESKPLAMLEPSGQDDLGEIPNETEESLNSIEDLDSPEH